MSLEVNLAPELIGLVQGLSALLIDVRTEVGLLREEMQQRPVAASEAPRAWHSTEDAAKLLGKSEYTVREYCRQGRVNAVKRDEVRGAHGVWWISADEIKRIQNEGLLPPDHRRNVQ